MKEAVKKSLPALPKVVFWLTPLLISLEAGLSMFVGYLIADFVAGKKSSQQGRIRNPFIFNVRSYRIHVHHWLVFLGCIAFAFVLSRTAFGVPSVIYGFLGGIVVQGIMDYDDWKSVIKRKQKDS
ncbi:MAG: hypothetical protein A3J30_00280 [Candidatus Wildermuthbacteria bacterium RIFCSPLOWO2_02_FULL_47_9c]|uniref:Uncharacterized protein n=1 Tax=Candidatus Wildermuthbacteria bacterium RIFCSPLOWO2_02_FULL_47_9c TaxID=1802466 RepID=A0A1G2RWW3_9BACT|nr:MAG: hypothetical protein A3J30_00280 [Candidatus Wildermuthbacteria bacterium RIFCSPLOWO2_02_FULL_47_9c]